MAQSGNFLTSVMGKKKALVPMYSLKFCDSVKLVNLMLSCKTETSHIKSYFLCYSDLDVCCLAGLLWDFV